MTDLVRLAALALAASLAAPGAARAKGVKDLPAEVRRKAEDTRRANDLKQAQQQGTPRPLDDAQQRAIGEVWARNQAAEQVGVLGERRGSSPEVKNLGRWISDDSKRTAQELGKLLAARGTDPAKLPPAADLQRIQGELAALSQASGDDFDRRYVELVTRDVPSLKDALGRARDATPGSDAELKQYLDQGEKQAIGHRDAARQLAAQRQARTPPPQQRPAPPRPKPR